MSDLATTLGDALGNPNVQNYLHMIASAEGTAQADNPYAVGFGGKPLGDLSQHPGTAYKFTQTDGKQNTTTAAGAYQFTKPTWDGIQKALNLPDFGPRSQDLAAAYLLHQNGSLNAVMNGDYQTALQKDGKTWAALPTSPYAQPHRSSQFVAQALGQGSQGSGGFIASANAADAPGASPDDLSTVPATKLLDAYKRASAAQDTEAMQQLSDALSPRLQQGLQAAQAANDPDAVSQIQGMVATISPKGQGGDPQGSTTAPQAAPQATPQAAPQQPAGSAPGKPQVAPVPGTADNVGPPVSAKPASTLDSLVNFGKAVVNDPLGVGESIANSAGQGIVHLGQQFAAHPLKAADNVIRGVSDTLTFGAADKLAALANSTINGTSYEDELLKQRQQDQAGGAAFNAGQLAGGLVQGSAPLAVARAVPTASKALRILSAAGAGAAEGTANYLGHNDGPVDGGDLATNAAIGAAAGSLPAVFTGPTQAQRAATFLRDNGGASDAPLLQKLTNYVTGNGTEQQVANAQRDAEIVQGLSALQNRPTQGGVPLGPADANALANGYTQKAAQTVRQMPPSQERTTLLNALDQARGLNDEQVNALRQLPNGDAVADAIQMKQRALSLTAPSPANTNPLLSLARTAIDNGVLGLVPGVGNILNLKSVRTGLMNVLGGRENRTGNIASAIRQADNASAFLGQYGPSQATQSAQALAQAAQSAAAARQAAAQAQQAAQANQSAAAFINRGQQAAQQARQQAAAAQAQGQQVFQNAQLAAAQTRAQTAAQQAAAAAQARQTMANALQGGAQLRAQAAADAAPVQQELMAQAKATQAAQAASAKEALKLQQAQQQALADAQASDPTYLLGMSNPFGPPRNAAQMAEFSKVMQEQAEAAEMGPQVPPALPQNVKAAQQAAQLPPEVAQAAASKVANGDFGGLDLNKPQVTTLLSYVDHPGMEEVKQSLSKLASENPAMGQKIVQLLTPGARNLSSRDFYGIQAALQGIHGAKTPPQAVQAAVSQSAPALAEATGAIQNPLAYKAGISARKAVQKNALEAAKDPDVKKLITKLSTTSKASDRADLFNSFMASKPVEKQIEAKLLAEPLITYGK